MGATRQFELVRCKYCGQDQPPTAFDICCIVKGKVYRRLRCQRCKSARTKVRRRELRQWLVDYKKTLRCVRCGFSDYRALEFHHPGKEYKDANVADMVRSVLSREMIMREISKCIVLCANCHQIEHYEQRKSL